jgi:hypothetical protein
MKKFTYAIFIVVIPAVMLLPLVILNCKGRENKEKAYS